MIGWKDIEIEDKDIIDKYYKVYKSELSDYNFTQLLLWQDAYKINYAEIEGYLVVQLQAPNETVPYVHMPVGYGDLSRVIDLLLDDYNERGEILTFRSITRQQYLQLKNHSNIPLKFKLLRDQYEYVYPSHDLSKLDTKKLKRKKDMYYSFLDKHNISVSILDNNDVSQLIVMMERWYKGMSKESVFSAERAGIERVLNNWDRLDTQGCIVTIDNRPVAFSFGEAITENMFLVLIEKAFRDYKGAYVAVIKEFATMYEDKYKFSNREEDLGIPGLRKAKLLFRPCRLIEKGVAYFTNDDNNTREG